MDKRTLFIRIISGIMAVSFIGLGATFVVDFISASNPGSGKEEQAQKMLRQTFDKNRELTVEVEALRERQMENLEKIAVKDQEVQRLVQKLSENVQLIQKLTKDRQLGQDSAGELEKQIATSEKTIEEIATERTAREKEIRDLKNQVAELQAKLEEAKERVIGMTEDNDTPIQRVTTLSAIRGELDELASLQKTGTELEGPSAVSLRDSMKLFQELKSENEDWKNREEEYQKKVRSFEQEVQKMEQEQQKAEERWKKEAERAKMEFENEVQRRIKLVESKLEDSERALKKTYGELQSKEEEIRKIEEESKDRKRNFRIMEHERETAVKEREDLAEKVRELKEGRHKDKVAFFYNLALAYTHAGLFREAEAMYLKVLELNPKDPETHYNLGILYEEHLNKIDRGVKHYEQFLQYTEDPEKQNKVRTWVDVAKRKYGSGKQSNIESADAAFDKLVMTAPS